MSDTIQIQEYNFLDYSLKLQEAVKNGYCIGDSVDGCPMIIGFSYTATLYKQNPTIVGELALKVSVAEPPTPVESVKPPIKGRKRT
jgi:hypothetical protein